MAKYFSKDWSDITVAFPVNILEIETVNRLAEKIQFNLLVESVETADFLKRSLTNRVGFFMKIDVGYKRTGISPTDTEKIDEILTLTEDNEYLEFKGFLTHAGHTYHCRSREEILAIHRETIGFLSFLNNKFKPKYPKIIISVGDTPGCSVAEDFSMFDEIRPGNFVFL